MKIQDNVKKIQDEIRTLAPDRATLVAVTKNQDPSVYKLLFEAGVRDIGENKWQQAQKKLSEIPKGMTKHFIGHLQTNKAKEVVKHFDMIQSVDSLRLAQKIDIECQKIGKIMPILIEVNTSDELQKTGLPFQETEKLVHEIRKLKNLKLIGVMTMAVASEDAKKIRACFKRLKDLFESLKKNGVPLEILSMGMSDDYKIALEEGSTMIRIGRNLFI